MYKREKKEWKTTIWLIFFAVQLCYYCTISSFLEKKKNRQVRCGGKQSEQKSPFGCKKKLSNCIKRGIHFSFRFSLRSVLDSVVSSEWNVFSFYYKKNFSIHGLHAPLQQRDFKVLKIKLNYFFVREREKKIKRKRARAYLSSPLTDFKLKRNFVAQLLVVGAYPRSIMLYTH